MLIPWGERRHLLIQRKPELPHNRRAAPARHQPVRIAQRIDNAARNGVGVAGKDVAILLRLQRKREVGRFVTADYGWRHARG